MMNTKKIMMMAIALMLISSGNAFAAEGAQQKTGQKGSGKGYRYGRGKKQGQRRPGRPYRLRGWANHAWRFSDGTWRTGAGKLLCPCGTQQPVQPVYQGQAVQPVYQGQPVYDKQGNPVKYQGEITYQGSAVQPQTESEQHIPEAVERAALGEAEQDEPAEGAEQP